MICEQKQLPNMLNQTSLGQSWQLGIAVLLAWMGVVAGVDERTLAQSQIVPDQTLGTESSVVTPSGVIRGVRSERIDGGASKGANLFHSFQDFNVGKGRGVYFTNPQGIENILSRVTGTNRSEILGRLGVIGNANLFLLNPNGILLGENASLDVEGSFFATTAEAIALGKQGYFSATQPQQSNLLSVSPGALFFNQAASQPGNIINRGNLSAGKDLTLAGSNLDLQGQLDAGENLTLQATDTAKIRDSAANPFLARSGGNLTIAGNQGLDILALNHPTQTSFVSGGNLSLISDGMISGDARFSSGGSLSIHNLSGGLANFISKYDPIISSNGDVDVAANYTGASLLIESKGNIRIQGDVNITRPDKSALPAGQDSATLSNSTALILRSGQKNLAYSGVNDGSVPALESGTVPQGITLGGDVSLQPFNGAGGLVSLTTASGDVSTRGITTNGGEIDINSAGAIANGGNLNSSSQSESGSAGNSGAIALTSLGNITTGGMNSEAEGTGNGGDITLTSNAGAINTTKGTITSQIRDNSNGTGRGGTIVFTAKDNIQTALLNASAETGDGGNIQLTSTNGAINTTVGTLAADSRSGSTGKIQVEALSNIITGNITSAINSPNQLVRGEDINLISKNGEIQVNGSINNFTFGASRAGDINIRARSIFINPVQISSSTFQQGNAGNLNINARDTVNFNDSKVFTTAEEGATGNAGDINIKTKDLVVTNGSLLNTRTTGADAGNVNIVADKVFFDSITVLTTADERATGNAGNINIITEALGVTNGSLLNTNTLGKADAGNVNIDAAYEVFFDSSTILTTVEEGATGNAGNINIKTEALDVTNGSQLKTNTSGKADAGSVNIAADRVSFEGRRTETKVVNNTLIIENYYSGISTNSNGEGAGGEINIIANSLSITNDAALNTETELDGQKPSGNINLKVKGKISVVGGSKEGGASKITLGLQRGGKGSGGNLKLVAGSLELKDGGTIKASTDGEGNAGNIDIKADSVEILGSEPSRTYFSGLYNNTNNNFAAGNIKVEANTLSLENGGRISALSEGRGNAGSINIDVTELLSATDSKIVTSATQSSGGAIAIQAGDIRLYGNSDITTNVGSGTGSGGGIKLTADSIIAFDDSDILTFASGGIGGDIEFNSPAFFGQNYQPAPRDTALRTLDGNNRVDVNASGAVSGVITLPDTSLIQNSISELPENLIDTSNLIANSCIARGSRQQQGSFTITGSGGLPTRPGDALMSLYNFGNVRSVSNASPSMNSTRRPWSQGDPIVEPQGVYQLSSGQMVLSRECP